VTFPIFTPIRQLCERIKTGKESPVALTEKFLERLERLGPKFNSIVTITRQYAIEQAIKAENEIQDGRYKGPLHGIPFGVKDLLATSSNIPTSWGAAPFKEQTFDYNATVIEKLNEAGAILSAKLAMIELAGGGGYRQPFASFTGPPRNPWNPEMWTGGSSSGSGAAVAAGMVPFAIGSETWGSILSPANNCGVTGLRPTYGRVSRYGAMALSWTLDKLGPLCLTADDCGLVLEAIAGSDPKDPTTTKVSFKYNHSSSEKDFKLAVIKDVTKGVDEDVIKNFENSLKILERFANIEEIKFPELPYEAVTRIILSAESASAFEEFIEAGGTHHLTAQEDKYGLYARTIILATDYLRALRIRAKIAKLADKVMEPFNAIIAPTRPRPASPINEEFRKSTSGLTKDIMGALGNGAGLPSISVPNGFTKTGLPTGIQFMGRAYEENEVIAVARSFQSQTDWHLQHPKSILL
jgi:aspartyl-tRNA(Asn)/glutamyl-tRNA(Gln) amidotransferase subunit A